jgi:hypothetical protein
VSTLFWDRQNQPIEDTIEWAVHFEDPEYRIVAVDQDDEGTPMVSTIWQGLDLARSLHATDDTAMIFETAYLEDGLVVETWHDHSEGEAFHRHRMVCLSMLGREPLPNGGLKNLIVDVERERKK